jgi:HSP20 family protein
MDNIQILLISIRTKKMSYQMSYLTPPSTWFRPASSFETNRSFLSALNREIDHVLDEFGSVSSSTSHSAMPRMSVTESDQAVDIEAELPGVEERDVEVALNDDVLTIKGEKRMENNTQHNDYCHQERMFGKFARSITLPFEPDPKMVKTLFARGVLKITLPKSVKIPVKATA